MKIQWSDLHLSKLALAKVSNSDKDKPPVQEIAFSLMYPRTGSHEANQHHKPYCLLLQMQGHCMVLPPLPSIDQHCSFPWSPPAPHSFAPQFIPASGRGKEQCEHLPSISRCPYTTVKKGPRSHTIIGMVQPFPKGLNPCRVLWKGSRCCKSG